MTSQDTELADFGWNAFFGAQLSPDDRTALRPARVIAVHRSHIHVLGPGVDKLISPFIDTAGAEESAATVGDWLLLDSRTSRPQRLLRRRSLFERRAAGTGRQRQLIAANVDTLFIVTSCNQEFNVARLERYVVLAAAAQVTPIIVLTKSDLANDWADFVTTAAMLLPGLLAEAVDARNHSSVAKLLPWCGPGQTVALVGSSGVGKSTLINTLVGDDRIATREIREDDDKGRHRTTGRALHRLPAGGYLLDTPGMRELQLADVGAGLTSLFADIAQLAGACRFGDCEHRSEPGCAIQAALESGTLTADRVKRWRKLAAEEAYNTESLAKRRARDRAFGKLAKRVFEHKRARRSRVFRDS